MNENAFTITPVDATLGAVVTEHVAGPHQFAGFVDDQKRQFALCIDQARVAFSLEPPDQWQRVDLGTNWPIG